MGLHSRGGAALLALCVLALLLRVTSLSRGLFTDEAYSLALAQRGFGHMLVLFAYESNGTVYSLLLWPLTRVLGTSEAVLRLPALVAGVASVPAMWWAANRLAGRRVAWVAAILLAINPMAIFYGQEARAYELALLSTILSFGALAGATARPQRRSGWGVYVAATVALAYCDLLAVPIVLPAQALLVLRARRRAARPWAYSLAATLLACLPLLVLSAISRSRRDPLYWLPKASTTLVKLAVEEFAGGLSAVNSIGWVSVAAGGLLLAGTVWRLQASRARAGAGSGESVAANLVLAACWGVLPIAVLLAVSVLEPVFWPRYAIPALPGLCLLAGVCADELWRGRRALALGAAGLVAVLAVAGGVADARQRSVVEEEWSPIAAWLRSARTSGEPTIVDSVLVLPSLGYYDPAFRAPGGELIGPEWRDRPLPAGVVGYKDPTGYGSPLTGPPDAATFARLAGVRGSVWMIVSEFDSDLQADPRTGAAVTWARGHCQVEVRTSAGVWALHATGCQRSAR